jgi:hypothetical protein
MNKLDLNDIQGLIKRGYDNLPFSNILLLRVGDARKVKQWLQGLLPKLSRGGIKDNTLEVNIAFTYEGFKALGLSDLLRQHFSREFEEGMSEASRSRLLGDFDPETKKSKVPEWDWRDGEGDEAVHLMLLVYGLEEHLVETYCEDLNLCLSDNGLDKYTKLVTIKLEESREHFGFHDGISQPYIEAFDPGQDAGKRADAQNNTVQLGEVLLGYPNQYGKLPLPMDTSGTLEKTALTWSCASWSRM